MGGYLMLNDYFDRIFCINLDSRPDRWKDVQEEFHKIEIDVERIVGINGSKMNLDFPPEIKEGAVGCALSQLFALKLAKQYELDTFLLLEDDIEFDLNINEKFKNIYLNQVPNDWDMLYLGGQHYHGMNLQQVTENVFKCEYTLCAHSVAFKYTVFDRFIDKLIDITKPCDVHYAESHKEINAYVIVPHLTWQKNSYSDIEKFNVDYTFLKNHRYPQWGKP
jgi:GR25 family glycosyltransferase involved in LPS biosynthesis